MTNLRLEEFNILFFSDFFNDEPDYNVSINHVTIPLRQQNMTCYNKVSALVLALKEKTRRLRFIHFHRPIMQHTVVTSLQNLVKQVLIADHISGKLGTTEIFI